MNLRPYVYATGFVLVLTAVLLALPTRSAGQVKLAAGSFFVPLFSAEAGLQRARNFAASKTATREELLEQNQRLALTNEVLRIQIQQLRATAEENKVLRIQVAFAATNQWKLRLGQVIGRDPANWWRTLQINLGSRHGVREGLPVLTPDGLVGRVHDVHPNRSRVALIGDPACRLSINVQPSRENGILTADGATVFNHTIVNLQFLPAHTEARAGDPVVTSGLGRLFPRGIPVGKLLSVAPAPGALNSNARVKLAVDSSRLNEVWVILP
jgi:rod shape-determining protein MreC|tara:strand:- start:487 stop:1293 length:807 start_codon:yes stop_codon:yes gene_type:complete